MDDWVARDLKVLWHPASHFDDHDVAPPLPIASARGCWLTTTDGHRILDGISSWWTSIHGHNHPEIVRAIIGQAERLDHVMLAGFSHAPAVELAETLLGAAPPGLGRVFYADCGSAAVEVALKMSFQSRRLRGDTERTRFAALEHSYHGETLGALGVSGRGIYRDMFAPVLTSPLYLPVPEHREHDRLATGTDLGATSPWADEAVATLREHASELTALVVEPLVQCAAKMRMMGTGFYGRLVREAQSLGIHVIADEIAVGFGRTGQLFASSWAGVTPDFMCLSKGLSGGVLPLSCVLVRDGFEADFRGAPSRSFLHSHTFTGNPLACAAGLASLRRLQRATLPTLPALAARIGQAADRVRAHPAVAATRQCGTIAAFDVGPHDPGRLPRPGRLSLSIREAALRRGVLLRPLHDTIYWMPPLVIDDGELTRLADVTLEVLDEVVTKT